MHKYVIYNASKPRKSTPKMVRPSVHTCQNNCLPWFSASDATSAAMPRWFALPGLDCFASALEALVGGCTTCKQKPERSATALDCRQIAIPQHLGSTTVLLQRCITSNAGGRAAITSASAALIFPTRLRRAFSRFCMSRPPPCRLDLLHANVGKRHHAVKL